MIQDLESKILRIATDYLNTQGHQVEIRIFNENLSKLNGRAGVHKFDDRYYLYIDKKTILKDFYETNEEIDIAISLVDTILHECCHIICMEENLGSHDGDYDFEKMIYDKYINSNYHRYPRALTMQEQIEGEKEELNKLSKILNISVDNLYDYLENREENFNEEYAEYISQILQ